MSKLNEEERAFVNSFADFLFYGGLVLFGVLAALSGFSFVLTGAVFTTSIAGLSIKGLANLPGNKTRTFLYCAGIVAASCFTAALIITSPFSLGLVFGAVAMMAASYEMARRFLERPQSQANELPFWSKIGYSLASLALVGLTVVFALIAMNVLPASFLVFAAIVACGVGVFSTTVSFCTPVRKEKGSGHAEIKQSNNPNFLPYSQRRAAFLSPSTAAALAERRGVKKCHVHTQNLEASIPSPSYVITDPAAGLFRRV